MEILVTGASGFIGSRLVDNLVEKGHHVIALVNQNSCNNKSAYIIQIDLTKAELEIPDKKFDVVFHLAALTPIEKNLNHVKDVCFQGTKNLFECVKDKTDFFVYVSGLGVFGDPNGQIVNEESKINPHTKYVQIRVDAQKFLQDSCEKNSIPLTTVYFGEVYGNGGWFESQIISRLKKGSFKMPKSGKYYRSVVHVDDAVQALMTILEKEFKNESLIVTDSEPVLFKDLINYTCDLLGLKHPGNIPTFLAKAVLGGDFVKLFITSIRTSNSKLTKMMQLKFPTYKDGIKEVISKLDN